MGRDDPALTVCDQVLHRRGVEALGCHQEALRVLQSNDSSSSTRELPWIDQYSGEVFEVTTRPGGASPDAARLKTYRDVAELFQSHPEPKSAGPDGAECGAATRGLLRRRSVELDWVDYVGKESHRLEEVNSGLIHDPDEVVANYGSNSWRHIRERLQNYTARELAEATGKSVRYIKAIRNGRSDPSRQVKERLTAFLWSRVRLPSSHGND